MNFADPNFWLYTVLPIVGPLLLAAAHQRGYKLPILSALFDTLLNKSPVKPAPGPATPVAPDAPAVPHPLLDALGHLLANVLSGRNVAGMSALATPDGNSVNVTLTLLPK